MPELVPGERTIHQVADFSFSPLMDEEDEKLLDEFDIDEVCSDPGPRFQMSDTGGRFFDKNRVLLVCVIVSLLIHFGLAFAIPRLMIVPKQQVLARDPNLIRVTPIVLPPQTKPEPAPEHASAISDHNHIAKKERIPKFRPIPPIGNPEPMMMASVPQAPAVTEQTREPKPKYKTKPKDVARKKAESYKHLTSKRRAKTRLDNYRRVANARPSHRKKRLSLADLTPTRTDYETAFGASGAAAQDLNPHGDTEEAVVDLNARADNKFYSYLLELKRKIQEVWVYPRAAQQSGTGGSLQVEFSIAKNGQLIFVKLLESSGYTILDDSALNAIHSAAPYMPLPDRLRAKRLRIRANFIYITKSLFGKIG
jgi:periplasmic protein TonB